VRGRLVWFLGGLALGGAALARVVRPRRPRAEVQPGPDPRAAELRRKLAESRSIVSERDEFEAAETPVDEAEPAGVEIEDRRRRVHEEGRAAARRMRRPPTGT
jgi:hypothetical protein